MLFYSILSLVLALALSFESLVLALALSLKSLLTSLDLAYADVQYSAYDVLLCCFVCTVSVVRFSTMQANDYVVCSSTDFVKFFSVL